MAKAKAKRKAAVVRGKKAKVSKGKATRAAPGLSGIGPFPPKTELVSLIGNLDSKATEISEIRGSMGSAVALSVKRSGTNKWALGIVRRLKAMSRPVMAKNVKHLLKYLDDAGLTADVNRQLDLFAVAAKAGASAPTPLEAAVAAKARKPKPLKVDQPEAVEAAPPPALPEAERPPISYN